jgi:adenylyltransferase/sulfurtransferase
MSERRYARHEILPGWGAGGQAKIRAATALVLGCGALGSHQAQLLVRAGVGRLRIVDRDLPEWTNLQRQILFDEQDVALRFPKAVIAARKLRDVNREVEIDPLVVDVNPGNVEGLLDGVDVALDATDNFETRYLLNDACVKLGVPWIYGGVIGSEGMVLVVRPGVGPCLRCAMPDPPPPGAVPTCDTAGVLNAAPAAVAAMQVAEALKLLLGADGGLDGLLHINLWPPQQRAFAVKRQPHCPTCGERRFEFLQRDRNSWATRLCGRNAVQIVPAPAAGFSLDNVAARLAPLGTVTNNGLLLVACVESYELTIFPDGRAIIHGVSDEGIAKSLYAKYVGL